MPSANGCKIKNSNDMKYDISIHNRHSIRLKSHDYSAGGLYFVTICAHREFIAVAKGNPFGAFSGRATQVSQEEKARPASPLAGKFPANNPASGTAIITR